jgi:hypothetical protein
VSEVLQQGMFMWATRGGTVVLHAAACCKRVLQWFAPRTCCACKPIPGPAKPAIHYLVNCNTAVRGGAMDASSSTFSANLRCALPL